MENAHKTRSLWTLGKVEGSRRGGGGGGGEGHTGPACLHIEWNVPVIPAVRRLMMTTGKRSRNSARDGMRKGEEGERHVDEVESGTCAPSQ